MNDCRIVRCSTRYTSTWSYKLYFAPRMQVQSIVLWKEGAIDGAVSKKEHRKTFNTLNFEGAWGGRSQVLDLKETKHLRTRSHMRVLVIMTRRLSVRPDRPTPSLSSAARQRTLLSSSSPSSSLSSLATSAAVLHVQLVAAAVFRNSRELLRQLLELAKGPVCSRASALQRIRLHAGDHRGPRRKTFFSLLIARLLTNSF